MKYFNFFPSNFGLIGMRYCQISFDALMLPSRYLHYRSQLPSRREDCEISIEETPNWNHWIMCILYSNSTNKTTTLKNNRWENTCARWQRLMVSAYWASWYESRAKRRRAAAKRDLSSKAYKHKQWTLYFFKVNRRTWIHLQLPICNYVAVEWGAVTAWSAHRFLDLHCQIQILVTPHME